MKRILLMIAAEGAAGRGYLRGIAQATAQRRPWIFELANPTQTDLSWLRRSRFDGCIVQAIHPRLIAALRDCRRPVVNVSGRHPDAPFPRVGFDEARAGAMAAGHYLDQGHRRFLAIGTAGRANEETRIAGFAAAVRAQGGTCEVVLRSPPSSDGGDDDGRRSLLPQMKRQVRPFAVFCSTDWVAMAVAEACRDAGLRIPEDASLMGVDNDEVLCGLAHPPLTSVALPCERVGAEALILLEALLAGRRPPRQPLLLDPVGVVARQSTDLLAIADPDLAQALAYIRAHAHEPINLKQMFAAMRTSRRSLERRFLQVLGRTPLDECRRVHLAEACRLLAGTDLPVREVARRSGFSSAMWLAKTMQREHGTTPLGWRQRFRSGS